MAVTPEQAARHIQLIGIVNDVSLRNLIPAELAKGSFPRNPPQRAGSGIRDPGRAGRGLAGQQAAPAHAHPHQRQVVWRTGSRDMQFDFAQLVAHVAKDPPAVGRQRMAPARWPTRTPRWARPVFAELRTVETLRDGKPSTPFMKFGDIVRIEVLDRAGNSVFGAIEQRIEQQPAPR